MHWRTREWLRRRGPGLLMAGSGLFVLALLLVGPQRGVPGYAEVQPVRIASLEAAVIEEIPVVPGQIVHAGDVVATLDDTPMAGRLRVLQAELQRQSALQDDVEHSAQAALDDVASRLAAARSELAVATDRLAQRTRQVEGGLASAESLAELRADKARLAGEVDRLAVQYGHLRGAEAGGDAIGAEVSQVRATAVVQEEIATLEDRLEAMRLRAPVDARVAMIHYRPGEVLPEKVPLLELLPLQTTTVVACLPEQFSDDVRVGSPATLVPAGAGSARTGTVVDVVGLVSEAPERCKQRPNEVGWVRPVNIHVEGEGLVPGQRFQVQFGSAPEAK